MVEKDLKEGTKLNLKLLKRLMLTKYYAALDLNGLNPYFCRL